MVQLLTVEEIMAGDSIITHVGDIHVGYRVIEKAAVEAINGREQVLFSCEKGKKFYLLEGNRYLVKRKEA